MIFNDNQIENNENFKNTDLQLIQNINTFGNDNIIRNSNEILYERDSNLNEPLFRPSQARYTLPQNDDYSQMDNTKSYDVNSKDDYLDIQEMNDNNIIDNDENKNNYENNNNNNNDKENKINDIVDNNIIKNEENNNINNNNNIINDNNIINNNNEMSNHNNIINNDDNKNNDINNNISNNKDNNKNKDNNNINNDNNNKIENNKNHIDTKFEKNKNKIIKNDEEIKENNNNNNNIKKLINNENNEIKINNENEINKNNNNINNKVKNNNKNLEKNNKNNFEDELVIVDKNEKNELTLSQNFSAKTSFSKHDKKKFNNSKKSFNSVIKNDINHTIVEYKIILIGSSGVGKTGIFNRYIFNTFYEDYRCTISATNKTKKISLNDKTIAKLSIWDTAGEEKYKSVTKQYFKHTKGAIIVYDINDRKSYEEKIDWINFVKEELSDVVIMIVGNKIDLDKRVVSEDEAKKFCNQNGYLFSEVSAKKGTNVSLIFEKLSWEIWENDKKKNDEDKIIFMSQTNKSLEIMNFKDKKNKICC